MEKAVLGLVVGQTLVGFERRSKERTRLKGSDKKHVSQDKRPGSWAMFETQFQYSFQHAFLQRSWQEEISKAYKTPPQCDLFHQFALVRK